MLDYSVFQDMPETDEGFFRVKPYEDGVFVTEFRGNEQTIKIPRTIGGKTVLAVSSLALHGCCDLLLPPDVKDLICSSWPDDWIDHICIHPDNHNFIIESGLLMRADQTRVFMRADPSVTEIRIPDEVTEICSGAFLKGANISAIHLGSGVKTIGSRAFPNTRAGNIRVHGRHNGSYVQLALKSITVSENNPYFSSEQGFLYSKDRSVLIQAPEIIPNGIYQVPPEVKSIAPEAFLQNQSIRSFISEHPLDSIGKKAFFDCFKLETVSLSEVKLVDEEAFHECEGLTQLRIDAVDSIAFWAFRGCKKLTDVTIEKAEEIGFGSFTGCWALNRIMLPKQLKKIGDNAFDYSGLKHIVIPKSVESVSEKAFFGCKGLNIELYDTAAFNPGKLGYNWDFLNDRWECEEHRITVKSAENDDILYQVYMGKANGTHSKYREAVINGWDKFPAFDFAGLDAAFASLKEPDEKATVSKLRLTYPISLTDEARKQYEDYLRRAAKKILATSVEANDIETVRFLSELGILKRDAIDSAISLCKGNEQPEMAALLLSLQTGAAGKPKDPLKVPSDTALLKKLWSTEKLPDGTLELTSYKGEEEQVIVPGYIGKAAVTRLGENMMNFSEANKAKAAKLAKVKSVVIPEGITSIGKNSFFSCANIEEITIPESVKEIGAAAFSGCSGLTGVKLPQGLKKLERGLFFCCKNLTRIDIPESVEEICDDAFFGCSGLKDENGCVMIRDVLYNYYGSEKEFAVPEGVTKIGFKAFLNNKALETVTLPNSLTKIGIDAFNGCTALKHIIIPEKITKLDYSVFSGCKSLESVSLPDGISNIEYSAFRDCKSLKRIDLPGELTRIEMCVFQNCSALETISIPGNVSEISYNTFTGCKALCAAHIPESVTEIGGNAFQRCPNLTIYAPAGSYAEAYAKENNIPFVVE